MNVTALDIARRFLDLKEIEGKQSHPMILAMLQQLDQSVINDDVPWCAAFVHHVAWLLDLPRSKSLSARSWLAVGKTIGLEALTPGFDIVILKRGPGVQPGPTVLQAPGHVALYDSRDAATVQVIGGNQSNRVSLARFPIDRILGVRRLATP